MKALDGVYGAVGERLGGKMGQMTGSSLDPPRCQACGQLEAKKKSITKKKINPLLLQVSCISEQHKREANGFTPNYPLHPGLRQPERNLALPTSLANV